jgi:uncharacterized membrane protein YhaH (DUF805 family)
MINFHNRAAVRIALLMAGVSSLLGLIPLGPILSSFWWLIVMVSAGFAAVYVYHKQTGEFLNIRNGMRMGWMTGLFNFIILLILTTAAAVALSGKGGLSGMYREQLEKSGAMTADVQEALKVLESPTGFAMVVMTGLVFVFVLFTFLPMVGGALGAKVLEKE